MAANHEYIFSKEMRKAYEGLLLPLGVYQLVGNKVVTLLVSDGLCTLHGASRESLTSGFDNDMFASVHPDDVEMLAKLGLRYATREGPYDIVYRTKLYGKEEYRYVHAVSKFHGMEDGSRIAITMYLDITESGDAMKALEKEFNTPAIRFLDESMGPMAVVSRDSHRILYYNKAITQMIKPAVNYDSGLTFDEFFYSGMSESIDGIFDEADAGLQTIVEPKSGREIEVNVLSCNWEDEPAYTVYLYEMSDAVQNTEAEHRHQRIAFNNALYAGSYNGLEYYEKGYRGAWLWNLTKDKLISQSGHSDLMRAMGDDVTFNHFLSIVSANVNGSLMDSYMRGSTRERIIEDYMAGIVPKTGDVKISTRYGQIILHLDIIIMESPIDGSIFFKLLEENVTDSLEMNEVIRMMVNRQYDFIAYIDSLSNHCRIINGNTDNLLQKDFSVSLSTYAATLADRIGLQCGSGDELIAAIKRNCGDDDKCIMTYERKDGSIKSISVNILSRENEQYFIGCSDVTQLLKKEKSKERQLIKARADADDANRAKSEFLSRMSHDIRTPLNGIIGMTYLTQKMDLPEPAKENLVKIDTSSRFLLSLINDVLDMSKAESGKIELHPEPYTVDEFADYVNSIIAPLCEERSQTFSFETVGILTDRVPLLDKLHVNQVMFNLLSNAVKYTPEGGDIRYRISEKKLAGDRMGMHVDVIDNGIGMSRRFQEVLFDPFTQENREDKAEMHGFGLGLAITKRMVDAMGGSITVDSEIGRGTAFHVDLTIECISVDMAKACDKDRNDMAGDLRGRHILLCEDHPLNQEVAKDKLV
jgi:signal transduction histidine kinase